MITYDFQFDRNRAEKARQELIANLRPVRRNTVKPEHLPALAACPCFVPVSKYATQDWPKEPGEVGALARRVTHTPTGNDPLDPVSTKYEGVVARVFVESPDDRMVVYRFSPPGHATVHDLAVLMREFTEQALALSGIPPDYQRVMHLTRAEVDAKYPGMARG